MKYFIALFLFFTALITPVFATDLSINNAGFVPSNIWYSKDPFYAGDKIRIYTFIFNGSAYDLTGAVEFFDNGASIGKTTFALASGGRLRDLWIDWKATEGKHAVTARLVDTIADGPNGKQSVVLANAETGKSERTIELDPVAKAAAEKAQAEQAAEAQKQALNKVDDAIQTVSSVIPAPVKEGVSSSANFLEAFRIGEAYSLRLAKENKAREIEAIKAEEQRVAGGGKPKSLAGAADAMLNTAEKPFAYVMLALFTASQYIFEWKVFFYGVLLYVFYRIIRWVVRKVRNRE